MKRIAIVVAIFAAAPASAMNEPRDDRQDRNRAYTCLSSALYGEARSDGILGMRAVAEVIMNRVNDPRWPDTVCGVVVQDSQFDAIPTDEHGPYLPIISDAEAMERAGIVASDYLHGYPRRVDIPTDYTFGSTHFYSGEDAPDWANRITPTVIIKGHRFFVERRQ